MDTIDIEPGRRADYAALCEHHYRSGPPATFSRVLRATVRRPTVIGRYLQQREQRQTVGVLVESRPVLSCRGRDIALAGRYTGLSVRQRARLINDELRTISRVIVHPSWRGAGVAVRLVREALSTAATPYVEAIAAMGRVNPFFEKAGMTAYRQPRRPHDQRLLDALRSVGVQPLELVTPRDLLRRIEQLPSTRRRLIETELRRWLRNARWRRSDDLLQIIDIARRRVLCEPVYYLGQSNHPTGTA